MEKNYFQEPVHIGDLKIKNRLFLAPLAGVSDVPFRRICQEAGAGLTYVEMLSSVAINYKNKRTFEMMARHGSESVLGVQVTGPKAEEVAKAIATLTVQGFDTIDINMGCPVKKVVGAGCGSAILKDPERLSETVRMAKSATHKPLSSKIRLGYTREEFNVKENVSRIILENADMFTIHGRTRSEGYSTPVDLKGILAGIETGKKLNPKPLSVGNGDVFCMKSANAMVKETGCDAVMVSRGALGNPWVFTEILQQKTVSPTLGEWHDTLMRHLDYQIQHYGNTRLAAILFRKHLLWYAKGFPGTRHLRESLNGVESLETAKEVVDAYMFGKDKALKRFSANESEAPANHDYDPKFEMDRKLDRGVGDEGMD